MAIWSSLFKPSIYRRVLAGFAIILSFIVVVVIANYLQLGRVQNLTAQALPASRHMTVVQDYALALSSLDSNLERFTVIRGEEVRDAITGDLQQLKTSVETIKRQTSEADLPSLNALDRATQELEATAGRFMSLQIGTASAMEINQQTLNVLRSIDAARQLNTQLTQEVLDLVQGLILDQENLVADTLTYVIGLAIIAMAVALVVAILVSRSLARPLSNILQTASLLAQGKFDRRAKIESQDETGQLAQAFNSMADQLQELIGGLENRVAERTRDLETVAQVNAQISTILDTQRLLQDVVDLTKERFGLYHSHVYLADETGQKLVLAAGAGHVGRQMVSQGRQIDVDNLGSIVAEAARTRRGVIINDVTTSPTFLANPLLPNTQSELAVPLVARGQLVGVLDVQSDVKDHFADEVLAVMELMAGQIAAAISNARLYQVAERTSRHEQALGTIERRIQGAVDMDEILQAAVRELGKALRVPYTAIELQLADEMASANDIPELNT